MPIQCEVVGFSGGHALLMPFAPLEGARRGCRAVVSSVRAAVRPSQAWLGRVVNAMGEPIDGKGRCSRALCLIRSGRRRRRPMHASGSVPRSTLVSAR